MEGGGPEAIWWQVAGETAKGGGGLGVFRLEHPNGNRLPQTCVMQTWCWSPIVRVLQPH